MIVGIKSVHAVMFGGHKDDVVDSVARDGDARHIQRLGVNLAVHRVGEQPSESA